MQINEHILKLTGQVSLPEKIKPSNNCRITIDGAVTDVTFKDNEDGTYNQINKFKPTTVEALAETGEVIKSKDSKKLSKKIRDRQWVWQQENQSDIDYDRFGQMLINRFDEVMDLLISQE